MNTRVYVPHSDSLPPKRWYASLEDARKIASGIATRGERATVSMVQLSGPDTEILLALQRWLVQGDPTDDLISPPSDYFVVTVYEIHEPTEQLPLPGEGPTIWDTKVVRDRDGLKSGDKK